MSKLIEEEILDTTPKVAKKKNYNISMIFSGISLVSAIIMFVLAFNLSDGNSEPGDSELILVGSLLFFIMNTNTFALIFILISWFRKEQNSWHKTSLTIINVLFFILSIIMIVLIFLEP